MFKTTFLENWGSGAGRIVEACHQQGLPEPEWSTNGAFVVVTFRRPNATTEKTTEKILSFIAENPHITNAQLAEKCGLTEDGIYYHIKKLKDKGVLKRKGGKKEGFWEYRTTEVCPMSYDEV